MKKFIITALCCVLAVVCANAQRHYVPHVHVGAHAGATLSQVSFYPKTQESFLPGMQMGFSFRYAPAATYISREQRRAPTVFSETPADRKGPAPGPAAFGTARRASA